MSQPQVVSGQFDRAANHEGGVWSLNQGPRTSQSHAEGRLVYNGAEWGGQMGNLGVTETLALSACANAMTIRVVDLVEEGDDV